MAHLKTFTSKPNLPPPISNIGIIGWARKNLFSSVGNIALTILTLVFLIYSLPPIFNWLVFDANLIGQTREDCTSGGACWVFINVRFLQFMFGLEYSSQPSEVWRPVLAFVLLVILILPLFIKKFSYKEYLGIFIILVYPFIGYALLNGAWFGLPVINSSDWGGLLLTFILSYVGIIGALPLGILLALGRNSKLKIIKSFSIIYIEFWRGSPLITVLFMSSVMFPLFLPTGVEFEKVVRAMLGIMLFQSAYVAEAVRGGLAAVPKGQFEAADAVGLGYWQKMILIVLPQALKIAIPGIVNTFVELVKDTSLVSIIALGDLLYMANATSSSIEWRGYEYEAYAFVALIYFFLCYAISKYAQKVEKKLDTTQRNTN